MFSKLAVTFFGLSSAAMHGERDLSGYAFANYVSEFGKTYSPEQMLQREATFKANFAAIVAQNANPKKTWFATVNKFTDMTNTEFKRLYHGHTPPAPDSLPKSQLKGLKASALPDAVDWRSKSGVVTEVKDQGGCGSCWAFSATETLESAYAIQTGEPAPVLSPQQIVSCSPNPNHCGGAGGCSGSIQTLAFNYTMNAGITTEADYPYQGVTGTCNTKKITPVAKNSGFVALTPNDYNQLATAVSTVGPVAISLAAGTVGWQIYGGGVYSGACGYDMDHAVQLVGYGTEGAKMYWIVRNSWGPSWGESGYIRIERYGDGKEPCGVDKTPGDGEACEGDNTPRTYCGVCGLMGSSSYPTGLTKV